MEKSGGEPDAVDLKVKQAYIFLMFIQWIWYYCVKGNYTKNSVAIF